MNDLVVSGVLIKEGKRYQITERKTMEKLAEPLNDF